jgi:hypothetical protein
MDSFLKDFQSLVNDLITVLDDAAKGDSAGADAANTAVQSDGAKLAKYDFNAMGAAITNFYKPLIDDYNSEVDKANRT